MTNIKGKAETKDELKDPPPSPSSPPPPTPLSPSLSNTPAVTVCTINITPGAGDLLTFSTYISLLSTWNHSLTTLCRSLFHPNAHDLSLVTLPHGLVCWRAYSSP